jgi:hypothetical protein
MRIDLNLASNLFGPLSDEIRTRLGAAIEQPGEQTWDDVHSIILNRRKMTTLWQAVIAVDPTFPRTGPATAADGRCLSGWARTPDRELLVQAINYATH